MVWLRGLDAEDAGVTSWTVGVAFTEGTKELGEECVGCLRGLTQIQYIEIQKLNSQALLQTSHSLYLSNLPKVRIDKKEKYTYEEYAQCSPFAGLCVLLPQGNKLLCQPLCFLRFRVCCRYRFVCEEGGNEVAKEGLSMGGRTSQMTVFEAGASHCFSFIVSPPLESVNESGVQNPQQFSAFVAGRWEGEVWIGQFVDVAVVFGPHMQISKFEAAPSALFREPQT